MHPSLSHPDHHFEPDTVLDHIECIRGSRQKYVEAGPEWPHEELRFTTQAFGATSQKTCWGQSRKNMRRQMLKKQAGASAKKTSGTLNERRPSQLKKVAAAFGGGNLFEFLIKCSTCFFAPAPACFFSICLLIFFWLWPQHVFVGSWPRQNPILPSTNCFIFLSPCIFSASL